MSITHTQYRYTILYISITLIQYCISKSYNHIRLYNIVYRNHIKVYDICKTTLGLYNFDIEYWIIVYDYMISVYDITYV